MPCWMTRSTAVGIPSFRFLPFSLGISTRRTGCGRYLPSTMDSRISLPLSLRYCRSSSTFIPSTPPAPLFRLTRLYARFRFPASTILSSNPFTPLSALVVLFSAILLPISAPAYPSCSALFFCVQPLPQQCFVLSFLSTSVTFIYYHLQGFLPSQRRRLRWYYGFI